MVNSAYMVAIFNTHCSILTLQHGARAFGQKIALLTFVLARPGTTKYTSQIEETNAILGEALVGAVPTHCTKARLQLFNGGIVHHYSHLMSMLANLILILTTANNPNQMPKFILIQDLKQIFKILASHKVQLWLDHHTRLPHGEHLAYAIAHDIHNNCVAIHLAQFALNSMWIQAVTEGTEILTLALDWYCSVHSTVIMNLQKASMSNSLGVYQSILSTWISPRTAKEAKEQARGRPRLPLHLHQMRIPNLHPIPPRP